MKKNKKTIAKLFSGTKKMFQDFFSGDKEKMKSQFANLLTFSRATIAPILILISVIIKSLPMSLIVIIISAFTDCIDGWYARSHNYTSEYGAMLDSIADKIFILFVILPLVTIKPQLLIIIILIELAISIINGFYLLKGVQTKSSIIGKIKTIILDISLIICYLYLLINFNITIINIILTITIIFQVLTLINYIIKYIKRN